MVLFNKIKRFFKHVGYKEPVLVVLFFTLVSCILTNWVVLDISTRLFTGGVGDGTSGFLWLVFADKGVGYMDDFTNLVNYPFGESLWSPIYVTWTLVLGPLWLLSRFMPPIAAMNVLMILAFVSCGVLAYYFIKSLTKNWIVALFGAYAITFVPYHIMKSIDHFTNIFAWVFVAIIWSFLLFWRYPSKKYGIFLALSVAAACYTDGYYIFVAGVLLLALFTGSVIADIATKTPIKELIRKVLRLLLVGGAALLLMLPLLFVQVSSGDQIAADLNNSRENVKKEIAYYSSKSIDFLLPIDGNITASQLPFYAELQAAKNSRSNSGENATYIGYVILILYLCGIYYCIRIVRRARKDGHISYIDYAHIVVTAAAPMLLIWMLPPSFEKFGLTLHSPTWLLAEYVPFWRVPSRVFLTLHPVMVVGASITLYRLIRNKKKYLQYAIVAVVISVVAIEYFTLIKRPSFGVESMPKTYQWLAKQDSIKSIAELPIVDRPIEVAGYAVFAQVIHGKPLVNSALSKTTPGMFNPLSDHTNPETINFLRDRDVDAVVLHARSCDTFEWGTLIHKEYGVYSPEYTDKTATSICVYRLFKEKPTDSLYSNARKGFSKTNYLDEHGKYWVVLQKDAAEITVTSADGQPTKQKGIATFSAELATVGENNKKDYQWTIIQDGRAVAGGKTDVSRMITASIDVSRPVGIRVATLEGGKPAELEVGLRNIQIAR